MALSSLLDIIGAASGELGLPVPATVVVNTSNTQAQARQMLALANAAGRSLVRVHEWSVLTTLATLTTVAAQSDYELPADFDRIVSETFWDESERERLIGPDNAQNDRYRRSSTIGSVSVRKVFRQFGRNFVRIYPTPTAVQTLSFEYMSRNWVQPDGDVDATALFAADTDVPLFDQDLMVKEIKWRFLAAKGMDTAVTMAEWRTVLDQLIAADLGGSTINMGPCADDDFDVVAGVQPNYILGEGGDYVAWD